MVRCVFPKQMMVIALALVLAACARTPQTQIRPTPVNAPAVPVAPKVVATPAPKAVVSTLPAVALLDFESESLSAPETIALSQALWMQLRRPDEIGLLPRNETRSWLIANDVYPFMPYQKEIPLGTVAQALKVDYLVTGRIERVGDSYKLSVLLSDRNGRAAVQVMQPVKGGSEQLTAAVEKLGPTLRSAVLAGRKAKPESLHADKTKLKTRLKRATVQEETTSGDQPLILLPETAPLKPAATPEPAIKSTALVMEKKAAPAATQTAVNPVETPKAVGTPKPTATPAATPIATTVPTPKPKKTPKPTPTPSPTATAAPTALVLKATPMTAAAPKTATVTPPAAKPSPAPTPAVSDTVAKARALQKEANQLPPKNEKRLELLKQAAALAPGDVQVLRGLANEYYMRENYGQCVDVYTKALKLDPNNSMLLTFRGSAEYCQDQLSLASNDFGKAVELDPNNHFARYNLALSAHMRKLPEAAKLWNEYLKKSEGVADQDDQRKEARRYLATLGKSGN